jgi:hypothetical protein
LSKEEKESLDRFDKLKQNKGDFVQNTDDITNSVSNPNNNSRSNITYSYEELKNMKDMKNREKLLSDDEFKSIFNMTKREFERTPIFTQHSLKKKFGLY